MGGRTARNTQTKLHVFIVRKFTYHIFSNHAHVHCPIPKDQTQTLTRLCKKIHGYTVSTDKENQATFTFITDLKQQTQNSAQTKHINIFIYAFVYTHTHTHTQYPFLIKSQHQ